MAVRRPKRPRLTASSSQPKPSMLSNIPLPRTPTNSCPTVSCEPWVARTRRAPGTRHLPSPPPLLVLPGRQRYTQNIRAPSRHSLVQHGEVGLHSRITTEPPSIDPSVDDQPLFSDSLYMPEGPIDIPRPRLSGLQKKQNQWRRWSQEVIPSLITPYLTYIQQSGSLQSTPDLFPTAHDSHCDGIHRPRSLMVTCVLFDRASFLVVPDLH